MTRCFWLFSDQDFIRFILRVHHNSRLLYRYSHYWLEKLPALVRFWVDSWIQRGRDAKGHDWESGAFNHYCVTNESKV